MSWSIFIAGAVPAFLAILVELFNPISMKKLRDEVNENLLQFTSISDQEATAIREYVANTSEAVVEISGIIPTWISITAAIASVTLDFFGTITCVLAWAIWASIAAVLGIHYFANVDYYRANWIVNRSYLPKMKGTRLISALMVTVNVLVIFVVLTVAVAHDKIAAHQ